MVEKKEYNSQIVSTNDIQKYSRHFADNFLKKSICCQSFISDIVDFSFYPTEAAYQAESKRRIAGPILSEKQENGCTIHLCEECLKDIPSMVLQGWLEQELTFCRQQRHEEFYCNFRLNILPLFPVVGLAENHIRELVHHLESGLRRYRATNKILDLGMGANQVYLYFFKLNPADLPEERYQETVPFAWTRALFLAKKLREFMPIALLARRNIGFSRDLESSWWKYHEYLLPEDKTLRKRRK
ncbi:hypothetical protein C6A37_06945 [Desulfobacteraceae bacterium SEEP-SAG9]|nr:hypothetical protein C6A37_06945 [Desulfobacteraceae bacterium SEEP-SAG9]